MIKKSLINAIGTSIGCTLGGIILPRLFYPYMYNDTYPPIWKEAILYLIVFYIISFLTKLLINYLKMKYSKNK